MRSRLHMAQFDFRGNDFLLFAIFPIFKINKKYLRSMVNLCHVYMGSQGENKGRRGVDRGRFTSGLPHPNKMRSRKKGRRKWQCQFFMLA